MEISPIYRLSQLILHVLPLKPDRSELESLRGEVYKYKELKQKSRKTRKSSCFNARKKKRPLKVIHPGSLYPAN